MQNVRGEGVCSALKQKQKEGERVRGKLNKKENSLFDVLCPDLLAPL